MPSVQSKVLHYIYAQDIVMQTIVRVGAGGKKDISHLLFFLINAMIEIASPLSLGSLMQNLVEYATKIPPPPLVLKEKFSAPPAKPKQEGRV